MKTKFIISVLTLIFLGKLISQDDTLNHTNNFNCKFGHLKEYQYLIDAERPENEGYFVNARKNGEWKEYYSSGNLKNKLHFIDGRPNGPAVMYYQNGVISEKGTWLHNRWTEDYISYYPNNQLKNKFHYTNLGRLDGCQVSYFENGAVAKEQDFENGIEISGISFYENGNIKEQLANQTKKIYNKDGSIKTVVIYINRYKTEYTETNYFSSGKISNKVSFKDKKRNGLALTYHENGNMKLKCTYKNGKLYGKRIYYDKIGKKVNGEFVFYDEAHNIERNGKCKRGKPEGEVTVYDSQGNVRLLANFKNGEPNGNTYFYVNNKLTSTEIYANGVYVSEIDSKVFSKND